jgi:vacuolar-type H+-ATPase subunit I/STV1
VQIAELEERLRREKEKRQKVEARLKSLSEAEELDAPAGHIRAL